MTPAQGDLWLMEVPSPNARPVLVVSRSDVLSVVRNIVVAPVTSTIRGIATCVPVGAEHGLDHDSAAPLDNLTTIPKSALTTRLGQVGPESRTIICAALTAMSDC